MLTDVEVSSENQTPQLRPARWGDLFIYLLGGVGLYFLASLALGMFVREMNIWTTFALGLLNFFCLTASVYLFGIKRKKISWESLGLVPPRNLKRLALLGTGLAVMVIPLRLIFAAIVIWAENLIYGEVTSLSLRESLFSVGFDTWYGIVLMVLSVGILAPIAEELIFRGLLYDFFRQKTGVSWAVLITSGLFGLAHYDSLAVVVSSFIMGLVMAIAVEKTKSLWVSIFMHVATNSGAIVVSAILVWMQGVLPTTLQY
ncbi:MAG: type II CAAX endopeptidase family protein [Anaerolineales bacterium]